VRIGQGWDIHRLVPGRPLRLGGITVPFERGLLGHSDGDAVLHAVIDALLGALAEGDIGQHFPDTDPRYQGIDSAALLREVVALVRRRRQRIGNVDVTILAERPKLAPYVPAMRARLGELLGTGADRVGIKAKTMEGLGAIGAGEAIAVQAVALLDAASAVGRARRRRASLRRRKVSRARQTRRSASTEW
jgi:2-C-methyl-D-erythritol 2,4-cyclodiphosphate synthase